MQIFRTKKKLSDAPPSLARMKRDIHNHLLPGIDDGSPDVATSLDMIRQLREAGVTEFVCTPHIFGDMFRNTPDIITAALQLLKEAVLPVFPDVKLSAAAEYMMDDYFMELLRRGEKLLTIKDNYLLTELSFAIVPGNIEELSFDTINAGYQPILAHPERYGYYHKNLKAYERLKELGFLFQLNLLSLTGYYGDRVKSTAKTLIKEGMIDFIGTDLHHQLHLDALLSDKSQNEFEKYLGDKIFNEF